MDCVFCDLIARGDVHEEFKYTVAILPLSPVTEGHTLIVPKVHVADFTVDAHVSSYVMERAARYARRFESCNIITSAGQFATQTVWHLHLHIIPRREGDGLLLPWSNQE